MHHWPQAGSVGVIAQALEANRRLQARLERVLEGVDAAIWRNAETQAKLACNAEAYPRAGRYRGMQGTSLLLPVMHIMHAHTFILLMEWPHLDADSMRMLHA
jgi:hypothetical protein